MRATLILFCTLLITNFDIKAQDCNQLINEFVSMCNKVTLYCNKVKKNPSNTNSVDFMEWTIKLAEKNNEFSDDNICMENPQIKNKHDLYLTKVLSAIESAKDAMDRYNSGDNNSYSSKNASSNQYRNQGNSNKSSNYQYITCKKCHGTGIETCYKCGGKGETECNRCYGRGTRWDNGDNNAVCYECNGRGRVSCQRCYGKGNEGRCSQCNGKGQIKSTSIYNQ
jgi:hypothetical protein